MAKYDLPVTYRTKIVETLGLCTRIVTQQRFDRCPLVAICNSLLLRNVDFLDPSAEEVSRTELLNLVGLAVLHYSSGSQNDSEERARSREHTTNVCLIKIENLAYKLNMAVRFTEINEFEFTPELEIFELLGVRLYHGWVVNPKDTEIAAVIGSKSHQTLMAELTAFRARKSTEERTSNFQGDCRTVDSAAAATGVVSPNFAKGSDLHDSLLSSSVKQRRGDKEEQEDLSKALMLSLDIRPSSESCWSYSFPEESSESESSESGSDDDSVSVSSKGKSGNSQELELSKQSAHIASDSCKYEENDLLNGHEPNYGTYELPIPNETSEKVQKIDTIQDQALPSLPRDIDNSQGCYSLEDERFVSVEGEHITKTAAGYFITSQTYGRNTSDLSDHEYAVADYNTSNGKSDLEDISGQYSCHIGYMPIYDVEDCKNCGDSMTIKEEDLGKLSDKKQVGMDSLNTEDDDSKKQTREPYDLDSAGKVIEDFLENSGNQLTEYGLHCLKQGIKEGDPCVFFCDDRFSTILQRNGELYLLATDEDYIDKPDFVWVKLDEMYQVNSDRVFVTGEFKEVKADQEHSSLLEDSDISLDFQVALILQESEHKGHS